MTPEIGSKISDSNIQYTGIDSLVHSAGRKLRGARLKTMMGVSSFLESSIENCASGLSNSTSVPFNLKDWDTTQTKINDLKQNLKDRIQSYHPRKQDAAKEIYKIENAAAVLRETLERFDFLFDTAFETSKDPDLKNKIKESLKGDIEDLLKINDELLATARSARFQEEEVINEKVSKPLKVQLDVLDKLEAITKQLLTNAVAKGDENVYEDLMKAKDELDFLVGAAGPVEENALEYAPEQDIQDHLLNIFPYLRDLADDPNIRDKLIILEKYLKR